MDVGGVVRHGRGEKADEHPCRQHQNDAREGDAPDLLAPRVAQQQLSVKIIRLFLMASSAAYLIAAGLVPDRENMITGLAEILMTPSQLTRDFFAVGGMSGTFLNVALVGFVCAAMTCGCAWPPPPHGRWRGWW